MSVWLVLLLGQAFGLSFNRYDDVLKGVHNRPVVGILSLPTDIIPGYESSSSYIAASYVKHIESAGLRVTPILFNYTTEEIDFLLERVNGVVLTGDALSLPFLEDSSEEWKEYIAKVEHIFDKVVEMNEQGNYFPLMGTSLGFAAVHVSKGGKYIVKESEGLNYASNVFFTDHAPNSKLFKNADPKMIYFMRNYNVTFQNHAYGVHPMTFQNNQPLKDLFKVIGLALDKKGDPYVAITEGIKHPLYTVMFHPEKPAYEWKSCMDYPHDILAIEVGQYFATFFATEARKSSNSFEDFSEFSEYSIYNHPLIHIHQPFEQVYIFN